MSEEQQIIVAQPEMKQVSADITPMGMLKMAVEQGADIDKLEKLMALQEKWEANEARKSYVVAMNAFKADPPEIFKDKHVLFETKKGITEYDHASLANVVKSIGQSLAKYDLSHRWDIDTLEGGQIKVTCVITHKDGHSESVPLQAGADDSGGKNNIQAKGSTITYLQRYTLLAASGLAAEGQDDDGAGYEPVEYITEEQAADIKALMEEVDAHHGKFCQYMKVTALCDIQAKDLNKATSALEAKRNK